MAPAKAFRQTPGRHTKDQQRLRAVLEEATACLRSRAVCAQFSQSRLDIGTMVLDVSVESDATMELVLTDAGKLRYRAIVHDRQAMSVADGMIQTMTAAIK